MKEKSLTIDEFFFLTVGYAYLKTGNLFIVGHPPLTYTLSSLPLLLLDIKIPPNLNWYYLHNDFPNYSHEFYSYNKGIVEIIVFLARIPIVLMSILLGFFLFKWAKELYGKKAGLFALFLYSFSPNILAHSRFVTTDIGSICFMFIALYCFWRFINNKTSKNLLLAGITFGLAQVSKFTALSLIPIYLMLMFVSVYYKKTNSFKELFSKKIGIMFYSFVIILIIGLIIINLTYGFQGSFKSLGKNLKDDKSEYFDHDVFNTVSIVDRLIPFENKVIKKISYFAVDNFPIMIPYPHLKSMVGVIKQQPANRGYNYFMGKNYLIEETNKTDLWYSYVIAFLLKTPVSTLIFIFLTLIFFKRIKSKDTSNEYFLVIPIIFFTVYFSFFFLVKHVLKYILPIYPFIFVFVSKIINLKIKKQEVFNLIFMILCGWYLFSSLSVYPHYLAYFNEFIGLDNGYKYLVGSNLEWGQDLKGLGKYVKEKKISNISLAYFGENSPEYYNINCTYLYKFNNNSIEDCGPKKGIIAISATYLHGAHLNDANCFSWLKKYKPIDKIGYSIFIYNVTE